MNDQGGFMAVLGVGCAGLLLVSLCACGLGGAAFFVMSRSDGGPTDIGAPPPLEPEQPPIGPSGPSGDPGPSSGARLATATVSSVEGGVRVTAGGRCEISIERRDREDGTFWCQADIRCAGQLLYGGPDQGFFPCTLYEQPRRDVIGSDGATHSEDGDAAMMLDTRRGTLELRDDASGANGAYQLSARVESIR